MRAYGYARVSTRDQSIDLQVEQIIKYAHMRDIELANIFSENISGKNMERMQFQKMMSDVEKNPLNVDAIIITKLDRIGRSLKDLLHIVEYLDNLKISLIVIGSNLDTTTREGRLFFHIAASFSEYERELILERTGEGRQSAIERGVKFGRKLKHVDLDLVRKKVAMGISKTKIMKDMKLSRTTLYNKLKEERERNEKEEMDKLDK
jgi:DNA invertase Pin-like site-specific DNA recombinase